MLRSNIAQIKKIVLIQFAVSLLAGLISLFVSQALALSVISGGLIASLANGYFAWKVFAKQGEVSSAEILTTYYGAEVGKIILTVMLFVAVFNAIKPLSVIALMCTYLFITMIPLLASFFINHDKE